VLIYERIREEQHLARNLKIRVDRRLSQSVQRDFRFAMTTIFSAFILFWLGPARCAGFAVTLAAGIALSLYTSLVVTRMVFNLIENTLILRASACWSCSKTSPHINFIGAWKICAIISTVVIIGSWSLLLKRGKENLGRKTSPAVLRSPFQFKQKVPRGSNPDHRGGDRHQGRRHPIPA